ncbi:MAG TPA: hypothetical protein VE972_00580 [Conexibacter sp.]|nr:hypothetical protein [Conexibacter sp.]
MLPVILAAAEHAEHSKTAFYLCGGGFAIWAVSLGVIGITRPAFPNGESGGRIVMLVSFALMVATMASAVLTAG